MKIRLFAMVATMLSLGVATQASAEIVKVVYTGTMNSGYDQYNTFGTNNTSISGDPFRLVFNIDTNAGLRQTTNPNNIFSRYDRVYGGANYNSTAPVSATLTINGHSEAINSSLDSQASNFQQYFPLNPYSETSQYVSGIACDGCYDNVQAYAINYLPNPNPDPNLYPNTYLFPTMLTTPFSHDVTPLSIPGIGRYDYSVIVEDGFFSIYRPDGSKNVYGEFYITHVTSDVMSVTAGVPEPTTWVLLLLGFVGVGFVANRRKSNPALMAV